MEVAMNGRLPAAIYFCVLLLLKQKEKTALCSSTVSTLSCTNIKQEKIIAWTPGYRLKMFLKHKPGNEEYIWRKSCENPIKHLHILVGATSLKETNIVKYNLVIPNKEMIITPHLLSDCGYTQRGNVQFLRYINQGISNLIKSLVFHVFIDFVQNDPER